MAIESSIVFFPVTDIQSTHDFYVNKIGLKLHQIQKSEWRFTSIQCSAIFASCWFDFVTINILSYFILIAPAGQVSMQIPHPIHSPGSVI